MVLISSERELLETFREFERGEVQPPQDLKYPFVLRDHFAWPEPSGHRTYLVVHDPARKQPMGVVFKRGTGNTEMPAQMCQWCHAVRSGNGVDLLTATASAHRRVGACVCRALDCKSTLKGRPGVSDLRESLPLETKLSRINQRMIDFATRNLF